MHKIEIVRKKGASKCLSSKFCEIWLDGKKLQGVQEFDLNIASNELATITLKIIGEFDIVDEE